MIDHGGQSWFTAAELAELRLSGLSGAKRKINALADEQNWVIRSGPNGEPLARRRSGRGGGYEYHISLLPAAARADLARRGHQAEPQSDADIADGDGAQWHWFAQQSDAVKAEASRDITLSVTSSGKLMQRPLSWPGWKTRPWLRHLSGTISSPSMADRGAAAFISSLPAIPVSHSPLPADVGGTGIRVTYGPTSSVSSTRSRRRQSSSKMSKATSLWDLPTSPEALRNWAMWQRRGSLQREKLARAMGVGASSFWPTPTASDTGHSPDLIVTSGRAELVKSHCLTPLSGGQIPLLNAARTWTQLWMAMHELGWRPISVTYPSSHRVQVSFRSGAGSFQSTLTSNPHFYDWMMGWPIGWTAPGVRATGFAAWLRRSRGELSMLPMPQTDGGLGDA